MKFCNLLESLLPRGSLPIGLPQFFACVVSNWTMPWRVVAVWGCWTAIKPQMPFWYSIVDHSLTVSDLMLSDSCSVKPLRFSAWHQTIITAASAFNSERAAFFVWLCSFNLVFFFGEIINFCPPWIIRLLQCSMPPMLLPKWSPLPHFCWDGRGWRGHCRDKIRLLCCLLRTSHILMLKQSSR